MFDGELDGEGVLDCHRSDRVLAMARLAHAYNNRRWGDNLYCDGAPTMALHVRSTSHWVTRGKRIPDVYVGARRLRAIFRRSSLAELACHGHAPQPGDWHTTSTISSRGLSWGVGWQHAGSFGHEHVPSTNTRVRPGCVGVGGLDHSWRLRARDVHTPMPALATRTL